MNDLPAFVAKDIHKSIIKILQYFFTLRASSDCNEQQQAFSSVLYLINKDIHNSITKIRQYFFTLGVSLDCNELQLALSSVS